jgi:hypothetical protein
MFNILFMPHLFRLVNMYSQWFDNESQDLQVSQQQLNALKAQFKDVQEKIAEHSKSLKQKESSLGEQEERLQVFLSFLFGFLSFLPTILLEEFLFIFSVSQTLFQAYQFKIQQKQKYVDEIAAILMKLNVTVPQGTAIDEPVGEFSWDDEVLFDIYSNRLIFFRLEQIANWISAM